MEVEGINTSPPGKFPYTALRTKLVRRLSPMREQRIHQLLTLEEVGDCKPSQFLKHLRSRYSSTTLCDQCGMSSLVARRDNNVKL
jgi:hypothetical protein